MKLKILVLACMIVPMICACDEDDHLNSHRLKRVTHTDGEGSGQDWKREYSYSDNRLTRIMTYDRNDYGGWSESFVVEITYTDNSATATRYDIESGIWEEYSKSEYQVQNSLILEDHLFWYHDYQWKDWAKWIYQYDGTDLVSYQYYYYDEGHFELSGRATYTYVDNKVMEYLYFRRDDNAGLVPDDKETFSYSENKKAGYIDFNMDSLGSWVRNSKCDYSYSGNQLIRIAYTSWDEGTNSWEYAPYGSVNYGYNSNGYLTEWLNDEGDKYSYEYEEGHGNAKYFYYDPDFFVYEYPIIKSARLIDQYVPYHRRSGHHPF